MKTIATTYNPSKSAQEYSQFWLPFLPNKYFSPYTCRIESLATELGRWVDSINNLKLHDSALAFIPVASGIIPDDHNRTVYCGFIDTGKPVAPIVIRGRALPELTAKTAWHPHENRMKIWFSSSDHHIPLTPGQVAQLETWFQEQLVNASTDHLLQAAIAALKTKAKEAVGDFIAKTQDQLDNIQKTVNILLP